MELTNLLTRLKMDHLDAQLDAICEQAAQRDLNYKDFLAQVLEAEWHGRYQRGIEARLRQARFPWIKTLEQFEFDFQPSLDRRQVREQAGLSFVDRAHNVVVLDPPGVGKTHLAIALGIKSCGSRFFGLISHPGKLDDTLDQSSKREPLGTQPQAAHLSQGVDHRRDRLPAPLTERSRPVLPPGCAPL